MRSPCCFGILFSERESIMATSPTFKLSRYNVQFDRSRESYLWNTLTGALVKVDEGAKSYISSFAGEDDGDERFACLFENGCIVPSRYDELGKVLFDEKTVMLEEHPVATHYTIAPGLGCNFACEYCFEHGRTGGPGMDVETQDAVCDFIIRSAEANGNLLSIGVTWFGGEPLLYLDAIERMSGKLMAYCEGRGVSYSAGIVTNGRFLTPDAAERLARCSVNRAQVSIDGMPEVFIKRKGATCGDFEAVVDNVAACAEILPITVRINVADDGSEALALTRHLLGDWGLDGRIQVYAAHVRDYCGGLAADERESHRGYLHFAGEYAKLFGRGGPYDATSYSSIAPKRRCTTCLSVCSPNYCIGPKGELYRCEHHFGSDEHVVGTVRDGRNYSAADVSYLDHRHRSECLECGFLPVCLGGCPNDSSNGEGVLACEEFKQHLIDQLMFGEELD